MKASRNIFWLSCFFLFIFVGVHLYAQKPNSEQLVSQNPEYVALAEKLDSLKADFRKNSLELSNKVEQVLANQDKILKELDVVRVRASRSR